MSLLNTEPPTPSGSPKEAHLQVAFGGESAPTDVAHKGLLTGVSPLVDLQRAGRREVLPAPRAAVLLGLSSGLGRQQRRHTWGHGRGTHKPTGNFNFDIGWLGSDKCGWNAAPTCAQGKEKEKKKTLSSRHSFILQTKKGVLPTTAPPPFESLETPFRKFTPWKQLSSYLATQRMTTPKLQRIFPIG